MFTESKITRYLSDVFCTLWMSKRRLKKHLVFTESKITRFLSDVFYTFYVYRELKNQMSFWRLLYFTDFSKEDGYRFRYFLYLMKWTFSAHVNYFTTSKINKNIFWISFECHFFKHYLTQQAPEIKWSISFFSKVFPVFCQNEKRDVSSIFL